MDNGTENRQIRNAEMIPGANKIGRFIPWSRVYQVDPENIIQIIYGAAFIMYHAAFAILPIETRFAFRSNMRLYKPKKVRFI